MYQYWEPAREEIFASGAGSPSDSAQNPSRQLITASAKEDSRVKILSMSDQLEHLLDWSENSGSMT